jgi:hypothetical protein
MNLPNLIETAIRIDIVGEIDAIEIDGDAFAAPERNRAPVAFDDKLGAFRRAELLELRHNGGKRLLVVRGDDDFHVAEKNAANGACFAVELCAAAGDIAETIGFQGVDERILEVLAAMHRLQPRIEARHHDLAFVLGLPRQTELEHCALPAAARRE